VKREMENLEMFNPKMFIKDKINEIQNILQNKKAIIACSGGVDSTTCAVLTRRAIGDNLICVFINTNFMRSGEPQRVYTRLTNPPFNLPVIMVKGQKRFMSALKDLEDAEEKRKAFRETFYSTLSHVAKREQCSFLVQGTILPDVLETVKGIKTQHNVLEQIKIRPQEVYGFQIVEPLVELYKYQVREVARQLGIPSESSERQPFPGPGLSVRVVGEITPQKLRVEKRATRIVERKLKVIDPKQYFCAVIDDKESEYNLAERIQKEINNLFKRRNVSVRVRALETKATGIRDGTRLYGRVILVDVGDNNHQCMKQTSEIFDTIQKRIISLDNAASRVLYRVTDVDRVGKWIIAIRSVETLDFVTASVTDIPWRILRDTGRLILSSNKDVSAVFYDVTPKPPSSIEFE
jgi:GMP synthase (glutamine-hydrolysing)